MLCYVVFQSTVKDKTIPRKAAIIDNLAITNPNPDFKNNVTRILQQANFSYEYYGYESVTVNFYRELPKLGYGLIILRAHSGLISGVDSGDACFYTSELITENAKTQYLYEMGYKLVNSTLPQTGKNYFGIPPDFVRLNMEGQLRNTVIIAMGCNSLKTETMAKALVDKGARVYIGWDNAVLPSHTDTQTVRLLEMLLLENKTVEDAVEDTQPDWVMDGSRLRYYPSDVGNLYLSRFIEKLKLDSLKDEIFTYLPALIIENQTENLIKYKKGLFSPLSENDENTRYYDDDYR
jgi:hypothetical protein